MRRSSNCFQCLKRGVVEGIRSKTYFLFPVLRRVHEVRATTLDDRSWCFTDVAPPNTFLGKISCFGESVVDDCKDNIAKAELRRRSLPQCIDNGLLSSDLSVEFVDCRHLGMICQCVVGVIVSCCKKEKPREFAQRE